MAANTSPIYSLKGDQSSDNSTTMGTTMTTATGDYTGISANHVLVYTANATDGGFIEGIWFTPIGTNTASVARVYVNNGSTNTTAANNRYLGAQTLPATTATNVAAETRIFFPIGQALKPGFRIYAGLGTTVAAGWVACPQAGQYS